MVDCSTTHHMLMKTITIHDSPDVSPDIMEHPFIILRLVTFFMFYVTKLDEIYKFSRVLESRVIEECPGGIPHVPEFV